ncbi:thioredoxin fold domain-containing protein [Actinoplanes sp. LDG1-06]|uniref:Thioredoxin n=1 Tax=Paractinoplanes ovalisporus TaxID=2810368 RepID=A0ABS2A5I5_9ACTN|nr:thioredoxin domain-containing protein [Actinoplanes ovalisporus]MBM2615093.1 thioredoxin fold domain-containing protein [Actinoplanes ovalisporus]
MRATTDAGFATEVLAGGTVLVDFRADWCGPCRQLAPVLEALEAELASRLTVLAVDVDDNPATARRYEVSGLPALILFVDGEPVHRMLGVRPKSVLRAELEPWIP